MVELEIFDDSIRKCEELISILLIDRNTSGQVLELSEISEVLPRVAKTKEEQVFRAKNNAEIFTPRRIVEEANKQVDWAGKNWPVDEGNWREYVMEEKLEVACGEAPFIVSRYNAASGRQIIKLSERVGFLDRKLQVVSKFCEEKDEWVKWAMDALRASYGFDSEADNLLIARENLLLSFMEYFNEKFPGEKMEISDDFDENLTEVSDENLEILKEAAEVISWNIFLMDGMSGRVPGSRKKAQIMNWRTGKIEKFSAE